MTEPSESSEESGGDFHDWFEEIAEESDSDMSSGEDRDILTQTFIIDTPKEKANEPIQVFEETQRKCFYMGLYVSWEETKQRNSIVFFNPVTGGSYNR